MDQKSKGDGAPRESDGAPGGGWRHSGGVGYRLGRDGSADGEEEVEEDPSRGKEEEDPGRSEEEEEEDHPDRP